MILVIDAINRDQHESILEDMYRLRARVFARRLDWDVEIENGMEIDEFDALDPVYLVGLDESANVVSCIRLLQTTGAHMLADVFSDILQGQAPLRAATLWESTRFCVDTERLSAADRGQGSVARATSELMSATLQYARDCGISDIITVIDPVMNRVLKRSDNAPYGYVGETVQMGKTKAMAALLDCSEERIARVRAFAGIEGDVFADEEALIAQRSAPTESTADALAQYFIDQIDSAENVEELRAALYIAKQVLGTPKLATQLLDDENIDSEEA